MLRAALRCVSVFPVPFGRRLETHIKDGKPDGLETRWDEDGTVVNESRFMDGEEVKE